MMLQHKVHRLPVVDDRNVPIGIATRTDIFEPLIAKRDDLLQDQADRRCAASRESPRPRPAPSPLRPHLTPSLQTSSRARAPGPHSDGGEAGNAALRLPARRAAHEAVG